MADRPRPLRKAALSDGVALVEVSPGSPFPNLVASCALAEVAWLGILAQVAVYHTNLVEVMTDRPRPLRKAAVSDEVALVEVSPGFPCPDLVALCDAAYVLLLEELAHAAL